MTDRESYYLLLIDMRAWSFWRTPLHLWLGMTLSCTSGSMQLHPMPLKPVLVNLTRIGPKHGCLCQTDQPLATLPDLVLTQQGHMNLLLESVYLMGHSKAGSLQSTLLYWHKHWHLSSDLSWRRVTRCYRWMTGSPSCRNNCLGQIHQVESRTEVVCRAQHSTCNRNDTTRWQHCAQDGSGALAIADSASKLLLHYCQAAKSHLSLRTSSNHTWKTCSRFWIAHQVTFSWTFHLANPFVWSCGIVWRHSCTTLTQISFFSSLQEYVWVSMSHWLRLRHGHNIQVCYPRRSHSRTVATAGKAPKITRRLFDLWFKRSLMRALSHTSQGAFHNSNRCIPKLP